jgi:hypothetical protein
VGVQMREGRFFDMSDPRSDSKIVIVKESFANRNFSGRSAVVPGPVLNSGNLWEPGFTGYMEIIGGL